MLNINNQRYYIRTVFIIVSLYTNIDQTLKNSLHGLLNCEIGGLDCRVSTTEYRILYIHVTHLQCIGPCNIFGSAWSIFLYNTLIYCDLNNDRSNNYE